MDRFVVLHKIKGEWTPGEPTTLDRAKAIQDGLLRKWPLDEIKIEPFRVYQLKQQNGTA